ncbi:porin [uncultured Celeribacter sp.]|uniref:porin n=1 Tax=uncultured Celeribacter sp. TaxID=1303376 RepID=UPI002AA80020|nr:porin [uncultured Celeribacter sp.]
MKNILLSSAAIALLAGAASAEVTWSGDAEIGYNDDFEGGFYYDAGLYVNLSQELNNGWTASAQLDIDLESGDDDTFSMGTVDSSDWVVSISNDMFGLSFGDVDTAYASFTGVGALYDNDLFAPADEASDYEDYIVDDNDASAGILLTAEYAGLSVAASSILVDETDFSTAYGPVGGTTGAGDKTNGEFKYSQVALGYDFGMFNAGLLYAEDVLFDTTGVGGFIPAIGEQDMIVANLGASFGGADFNLSYMDYDAGVTGVGLDVSYPIGPVVLGAYYVSYDFDGGSSEDDAYGVSVDYSDGPITVAAYYEEVLGEAEYAVEGAYDFGFGLVVTAGYIDGDDDGSTGSFGDDDDFATYIVAEYDLGGGASFLASYADANSVAAENTDDIDTGIGGYELLSGTTLALSFEF